MSACICVGCGALADCITSADSGEQYTECFVCTCGVYAHSGYYDAPEGCVAVAEYAFEQAGVTVRDSDRARGFVEAEGYYVPRVLVEVTFDAAKEIEGGNL